MEVVGCNGNPTSQVDGPIEDEQSSGERSGRSTDPRNDTPPPRDVGNQTKDQGKDLKSLFKKHLTSALFTKMGYYNRFEDAKGNRITLEQMRSMLLKDPNQEFILYNKYAQHRRKIPLFLFHPKHKNKELIQGFLSHPALDHNLTDLGGWSDFFQDAIVYQYDDAFFEVLLDKLTKFDFNRIGGVPASGIIPNMLFFRHFSNPKTLHHIKRIVENSTIKVDFPQRSVNAPLHALSHFAGIITSGDPDEYHDIFELAVTKPNININVKNKKGNTPLHCLVDYGFLNHHNVSLMKSCAKLLLKNGANKSITNDKGLTPLALGRKNGFPNELLDYIKDWKK